MSLRSFIFFQVKSQVIKTATQDDMSPSHSDSSPHLCFTLCESPSTVNWRTTAPEIMQRHCVNRTSATKLTKKQNKNYNCETSTAYLSILGEWSLLCCCSWGFCHIFYAIKSFFLSIRWVFPQSIKFHCTYCEAHWENVNVIVIWGYINTSYLIWFNI